MVPDQSILIPGPVYPFVVLQQDPRERPREIDVFDDVVSGLGAGFHSLIPVQ